MRLKDKMKEKVRTGNYTDIEWNRDNLRRYVDYSGVPLKLK